MEGMSSNMTAAMPPPSPPPQSGGSTWQGAGYTATLLAVLIGLLAFVAFIKGMQTFFEKQKKCLGLDHENQVRGEDDEEQQENILRNAYPQVFGRAAAAPELRGFSAESISELGGLETFHVDGDGDLAKLEEGAGGEGVCVICQLEFSEGQVLRRLHSCLHSFHQDCVDAWLKMNTMCPLCRTTLQLPESREEETQTPSDVREEETRILPEDAETSTIASPSVQQSPGNSEVLSRLSPTRPIAGESPRECCEHRDGEITVALLDARMAIRLVDGSQYSESPKSLPEGNCRASKDIEAGILDRRGLGGTDSEEGGDDVSEGDLQFGLSGRVAGHTADIGDSGEEIQTGGCGCSDEASEEGSGKARCADMETPGTGEAECPQDEDSLLETTMSPQGAGTGRSQ